MCYKRNTFETDIQDVNTWDLPKQVRSVPTNRLEGVVKLRIAPREIQ